MKRLSDSFSTFFILNKLLGIWPGRQESKYYKYFSYFYLFTTFVVFFILLTLNLFYTPRQVELFIHEVVFFFTSMANGGKIYMVVFKRREILKLCELLDSEMLKGDYDEVTKEKIACSVKKYQTLTKIYIIFPHFPFASLTVVPVLLHWKYGGGLELPVCNYFFLSDQVRNDYFAFWYIYQSFPLYCHMIYNITADTFIAGLIHMATIQLRVINHKLCNLTLSDEEKTKPKLVQHEILMSKLINCLKHYNQIIEYCALLQKIISSAVFILFGVSAIVICISFSVLMLMPLTSEMIVFMVGYLAVMVGQIFLLSRLGSELEFECRELVVAAMKTDWVGRPKTFVNGLILFMVRANNPLSLSGMKFFPLVLNTFISIMKTAYSFFTLVRNVQNRHKES